MRISDWISDVCSSDLASGGNDCNWGVKTGQIPTHFKRRQAHTVRTWRTTLQGVDGSRIARWASIIPPSKPPEIAIASQAALIIEKLSVLAPVNCNGHLTLLPRIFPTYTRLQSEDQRVGN